MISKARRQQIIECWDTQIHATEIHMNNSDVRDWVKRKHPFKASNMFAKWECPGNGEVPLYVVYSFGKHYPMFIFEPIFETWFENSQAWSRTTGKHRSKASPGSALPLDCGLMKAIVDAGIETTFKRETGESYEFSNEA